MDCSRWSVRRENQTSAAVQALGHKPKRFMHSDTFDLWIYFSSSYILGLFVWNQMWKTEKAYLEQQSSHYTAWHSSFTSGTRGNACYNVYYVYEYYNVWILIVFIGYKSFIYLFIEWLQLTFYSVHLFLHNLVFLNHKTSVDYIITENYFCIFSR